MLRPQVLFPLAAPLTSLSGVGQKLSSLLSALCGVEEREGCVSDLVWHLPTGLIDRSQRLTIAELEAHHNERVMLEVEVGKHTPAFQGRASRGGASRGGRAPRGRRSPYRVEVFDDSGTMPLVFFYARGDYLKKLLPIGERRIISGSVEIFREKPQMTHPDYILTLLEAKKMPTIEPVYPLRAGVSLQKLGKIIRDALSTLPALPEWDKKAQAQFNFPSWKDAVMLTHYPKNKDDLSPTTIARQRLAYDELLANQLALALLRHWRNTLPAQSFPVSEKLRAVLLAALAFELTNAQKEALAEIDADLEAPKPMLRLLQGDVGSGKTITAFLAMLNAVEAGAQAAMMVPTEILAQQHGNTLRPLCEKLGLHLEVLTSRTRKAGVATRHAVLENLSSGKAQVIIGTHSLFQKDVLFHNLGVVVIDEQHKFGVHQRLLLSSKSLKTANVLAMTATPIPRTLTLTAYGDMDISVIKEKPVGRKEIKTSALPLADMNKIVSALERAIAQGEQAYWVCPFIDAQSEDNLAPEEEEEKNKNKSETALTAVERFEFLTRTLQFPIGLVHGRMNNQERDETMLRFKNGEIKLLVATSVVEVGMDVPSATIMVIENAERFGLAQLHQLRGRVGRSDKASSCLLIYAESLGVTAKERLNALRRSNDGFDIAETDLKLRGFGELLGTRQSGAEGFRLSDLRTHKNLLVFAAERAQEIIQNNPGLKNEEGENLRLLLYLFRRDEVSQYIRS